MLIKPNLEGGEKGIFSFYNCFTVQIFTGLRLKNKANQTQMLLEILYKLRHQNVQSDFQTLMRFYLFVLFILARWKNLKSYIYAEKNIKKN